MSQDNLLNVKQVAQYLQLKESTIILGRRTTRFLRSRSAAPGASVAQILIRGWSDIYRKSLPKTRPSNITVSVCQGALSGPILQDVCAGRAIWLDSCGRPRARKAGE